MESVAKEGRTVLFVSHSIGAVRSLCDSVVWLDDGRIRQNGATVEVTHDYLRLILDQMDEDQNTVELDNLSRNTGIGTAFRFTRLSLNDGKPVYHGEPLNVTIDYQVLRDVDGVSVGLGFNSIEGIRLVSVDSDLEGRRYDLSAGKRGTIKMKLDPLLLQPDRYLIDVVARSGVSGKGALDYSISCMAIDVLPGARTPGFIMRRGGGIRMPAHWRWEG